ncbi:MAG: hypothetical protein WCX95_01210 [Candidatus Gracilibacteria bacterium]
MKNHNFLILSTFLSSFPKEKRLVFLSAETGPEPAEVAETRSREEIIKKGMEASSALGEKTASKATETSDLDNVLDQLNRSSTSDAERLIIFNRLLDDRSIIKEGESTPSPIKLETFSETQFLLLLKTAIEQLTATTSQNLAKISTLISPQGPFNAVQLGKEAIGILLKDQNPENTKKVMEVIAKSPTRLSELIEMYSGNLNKLRELFKALPDATATIKKWLTNSTLSKYFSTDALAILLNSDIFRRTDFNEEFINKLSLSFKAKIDLLEKLTDNSFWKDALKDHIVQNFGKVIEEDPNLIDSLLNSSIKAEILPTLKSYLKGENQEEEDDEEDSAEKMKKLSPKAISTLIENGGEKDKALMEIIFSNAKEDLIDSLLTGNLKELVLPALKDYVIEGVSDQNVGDAQEIRSLSSKAIAILINEYFGDKALMEIIFDNMEEGKKMELIDQDIVFQKLSKEQRDALLIKINPLIGDAIKKFHLERVGNEYRILGQPETYFFKGKTPDKIYRKGTSGIASSPIEGETKWTVDQTSGPSDIVQDTIGKASAVKLNPGKKLYTSSSDTTGVEGTADQTLEIVKGVNPEKKGTDIFIKVKTQEASPKEFFVKLSDVTPVIETAEKTLGKYVITTGDTMMFPDPAKQQEGSTGLPSGQKLSIIGETAPKIITGRTYIKTKWLEGAGQPEGWVESTFLKRAEAPTLQGEKSGELSELYEKYFMNFAKVEETKRTLTPGFYHPTEKGAEAFLQRGALSTLNNVKFEIKDPKIYKITKNPKEPSIFVVKFENTQLFGGLKQEPSEGYIDIDSLIMGDKQDEKTTGPLKLAESEWTEENYAAKKVPNGKSIQIPSTTRIYGSNPDFPHVSQPITKDQEATIIDQRVKLVEGKEYIKVKVGETTGWVALKDVNIPESETILAAQAEKTEQGIAKKQRVEFLTPISDPADPSGKKFTVTFKSKALETATKLSDIFYEAVNGDQVEIIPKGQDVNTKIVAEFKDGTFYKVAAGKITKEPAKIYNGDTVEFKPKTDTFQVTKTVDKEPDTQIVTFRDEGGRLLKDLEMRTKLTDRFINLEKGDKVFITPKSAVSAKSEVFDSAEFDGKNFIYTDTPASHRKIGARAVIFDGDKVQLLRDTSPQKFKLPLSSELEGGVITVVNLMPLIYKEHPNLQATIASAGLTEGEYYQKIIATQDSNGNITILKPEKPVGEHYGTFQLPKEEMTVAALMALIYAKRPKLKKAITAAGLNESEYYQQILATKDRNGQIYILKPVKYSDTTLSEFDRARGQRLEAVSKENSKSNQKILKRFDHYYENEFKIAESLLRYANNDELWNDLWEHRTTETQNFIEGLEPIMTIMREDFHIDEKEIRSTLRNIIQEGDNDHVDFEDIFKFLAKPLYLKLKEAYKEETGFLFNINTHKDFRDDLNDTQTIVQKWETGNRKTDLTRILTFKEEETRIKGLEETARAENRLESFRQSEEYIKYQRESAILNASRGEKGSLLSEYENEYVKSSARLSLLVNKILVPSARLLEAIKLMGLRTSTLNTTYNTYNNYIDHTEKIPTAEVPQGTLPYYDLGSLTTPTKGTLAQLEEKDLEKIADEGQEKYAVTISPKSLEGFKATGKDLGLTDEQLASFKEDSVLKLIFQLYSVETLTKDGCLKRIADQPKQPNRLLLVKLPDNFAKDTLAVKELFKELKKSEDIDTKQDLIQKTAELLDKSKKMLAKVAAIYGKDSPKVHLLWTEWMKKQFTGEDTRSDSMSITMGDIGEGLVTLPSSFFLNHMSGQAAQDDVLEKATKIKEGVTVLDEAALKDVLHKDLKAGLKALPLFANNITDLKEFEKGLIARYAGVVSFVNVQDDALFNHLVAKLDQYLDNPTQQLTGTDKSDLITLMQIGHVFTAIAERDKGAVSESGESLDLIKFSTDPAIRKIQGEFKKALELKGEKVTQEQATKIESACIFGIGIMASTKGGTSGAGIGVPIDLGDGWNIAIGAGLGSNDDHFAATAGASLEKTFTISKDGKTQISVGLDAGILAAGGHVGIKFAISNNVSGGVTAGAGWSSAGFYLGAIASIHHEAEWEREAATQEAMSKLGYDRVEAMLKADYPEEMVVAAIHLLPNVGKTFVELQDKYQLSNKVVIELYKKQKTQVDTEVVKGLQTWAGGMGGGVGLALLDGIPIPNFYIDIPLGTGEICIVRTTVEGSESLYKGSDAKVRAEILRQMRERHPGAKVTILENRVENNGQFIYDSVTGQAAVLQGKETKVDFTKYNQLAQLNTKLNTIGINLVPDKASGLTRVEVPNARGNIKFLIDPSIKEQLVLRNGEIYLTIGDTHTDLIFNRQNFSYPYQYDGANTLGVITITSAKSPLRTRAEIEKESPTIIYQRPGYRAEIRKGYLEEGLEIDNAQPSITTYEDFKKQTPDPEYLANVGKTEEMNRKYAEFVTLSGVIKTSENPRESFDATKFGDAFLAGPGNSTEYKALSTRLVKDFYDVGLTTTNNQKLNALIQKFAESYPPTPGVAKLGRLNNSEMQQVLTDLMTKSFIKLPNNAAKEKVFRHNLEEFGKKYLTLFFEESQQQLKKLTPAVEVNSSAEKMAQHVINELKKVKFGDNPETGLEQLGLLSLVGTSGIKGIRGTPTYGKDLASGILNLNRYSTITGNAIEKDIGKVIIEIASPLNLRDDQTFMQSPLSVKMLAHTGMFLILGPDDSLKVAQCFKAKTVSAENKDAFEKFKRIVLAIRSAQLSGEKTIDYTDPNLKETDLPDGYHIGVEPTTSIGVYQKCGNPTIAFEEGIAIFVPKTQGMVSESRTYDRVDANSKIGYNTFRLGIALKIEPEPPTTVVKDPARGASGASGLGEDAKGADLAV